MNPSPAEAVRTARVLLWGDSLTEGRPGVAFADFLAESNPHVRFENNGRGGDTVSSLLTRLLEVPAPPENEKADLAVLWIGVNDLFAEVLPGYALWKTAWGQPPSRDIDAFIDIFKSILERLTTHAHRILVLPPLFVGEDPRTEMNQRIREWGDRISVEISGLGNCRFVDIRPLMPLTPTKQSRFLPVNPWAKIAESVKNLAPADYDEASIRRGLTWTFDGIHLNSNGARTVSRILTNIFPEEGL
ncbi:MAG: SGNH/GDSL hydrolase family protein [Spirochaetaceae bacterium]|nr:SGNH/GDSL hydrolase family protein [Spirochaetaceae bacterium]MDT8298700.1 SGNH/GDSL hydrolase family protein [Spirochaetaceae bacterium]